MVCIFKGMSDLDHFYFNKNMFFKVADYCLHVTKLTCPYYLKLRHIMLDFRYHLKSRTFSNQKGLCGKSSCRPQKRGKVRSQKWVRMRIWPLIQDHSPTSQQNNTIKKNKISFLNSTLKFCLLTHQSYVANPTSYILCLCL